MAEDSVIVIATDDEEIKKTLIGRLNLEKVEIVSVKGVGLALLVHTRE